MLARSAKPFRCIKPSGGAGWRCVCAKILLQNFLDPNRAGGCGVAPFSSGTRFRLWVSVCCAGCGKTNATKAAHCRPWLSAARGERLVRFYSVRGLGDEWAIFLIEGLGLLRCRGELRRLLALPRAGVGMAGGECRQFVKHIERVRQ